MQPSECDAVAAFKQQLGIHSSEDAVYGWIAEVGLQSPLPPRWTSHTDTSSGYVYYVDHDRQVSSWENPLVPFLRRVVEIGRNYQKQPSDAYFEEQKGLLWHQHKHELDCWHGPFSDEGGRQYFVNATEGVSSWQDPRVDAQYIFELESGLLTSLEEVLNHNGVPDTPGFGPGSKPWHTAEGAEVLTLDEPGAASGARPASGRPDLKDKLLTQAQWNAKEEHKSTLQRMSSTAGRFHHLQLDDMEVQRLQFSKKVEARRQRHKDVETKEEWGAHMRAGTARIPQDPATIAREQAPAAPLEPQAEDAERPSPPAPGGVLPPPPPPQHGGLESEPLPPAMSPRSQESDSRGLDIFKPPSALPSPLAGSAPVMPPEVEHRLKKSSSAEKPEAFVPSSLGALELKTDGGGQDAEA